MLLAVGGVAGLCTCIDSVKDIPLFFRVISGFLVGLIPVWKFDDEFAVGIHRLCDRDDLPGDFFHLIQPKLCPCFLSLGLKTVTTAAGSIEEIIQDDLIKKGSGISDDVIVFLPVSLICEAEGVKYAEFCIILHTYGGGDSSGYLDTLLLK